MSDTVITVEHLSKRYLVRHSSNEEGHKHYVALRDVISNQVRNIARNAINVVHGRQVVLGDKMEEFWALKDVSFEVERGEVLGIIGHNGAGKSTILKILSRTTEPTRGRVTLRGRVASLLEVGTGFHPELTGRENIYLNGAILGMNRAELRRKFDEIVAFAEVEKFLDTPVKRYSSGMYVRLAFAVAAHLEPEILIVDEVLAVGDAEFQKKCLSRMSQVGGEGRTVLFVSHNMTAVQALCQKAILVQNGRSTAIGFSRDIVAQYLTNFADGRSINDDFTDFDRRGNGNVRFRRMQFFDRTGRPIINPRTGEELYIGFEFEGSHTERRPARLSIDFYNILNAPIFFCASETSHTESIKIGAGDKAVCRIPRLPLSAGRYKIELFLEINGVIEDWLDNVLIDVADGSFFGTARNLPLGWEGTTVLVDHEWLWRYEDVDRFKIGLNIDEDTLAHVPRSQ